MLPPCLPFRAFSPRRVLLVALFFFATPGCRAIVLPKQQPVGGHFLTPSELGNISSVACLEAKQKNPSAKCGNLTTEVPGNASSEAEFVGPISVVNYPIYRQSACHSGGAFFCDPAGSMNQGERENLTTHLERLRERDPSLVMCGALLNDPVNPRHLQPFYLGVAVLSGWPAEGSTPESLQQLGLVIDTEWDMDKLYVGHPVPLTRCPTTAMLLLLPETKQAFLSSSSCDFICASKGGSAVASKAIAALKQGGEEGSVIYAAALAGAEEVYNQLAIQRKEARADRKEQRAAASSGESSNDFYLSNLLQRIAFGLALLALAGAFALGFAVLLVGPGLVAHRKKFEMPP